nr:NADH dehydrogenase subunit 6 [Aedeomyia squamipennis]
MTIFFIFISFIISFIFSKMKHPLAMGIILLLQTFYTCIFISLYIQILWFSYSLFLIFIGGMLILFIYVTSLSSNEMFSTSMNLMFSFFMFLIISMLMILLTDKSLLEKFTLNSEIWTFNNFKMLYIENTEMLNKMYNFPINLITLMLINYLFLTLLMAVKVTKKNYGPLRPMN